MFLETCQSFPENSQPPENKASLLGTSRDYFFKSLFFSRVHGSWKWCGVLLLYKWKGRKERETKIKELRQITVIGLDANQTPSSTHYNSTDFFFRQKVN